MSDLKDTTIEEIVARRKRTRAPLHTLMPQRVTQILLVSSLYDSFTFEEEGGLSEMLFAEYLQLNLRYAPRIERVSTGAEALQRLATEHFDLAISMMRIGDMDIREFSAQVNKIDDELPVILLAYNTRELDLLEEGELPHVDRTFVWQGDHRLFVAIIKYVEDRLNVDHDVRAVGVQTIILVEDSARFYSSYLPMLYSELVKQTQSLMCDGVNTMQKLIRMRARPKILLATTFEEGMKFYTRYRDQVLGVVADAAFPRHGVRDEQAGLDFALAVKADNPECPVLMQSSDEENRSFAHSIGVGFINKRSPALLADVRQFMKDHLGFGEFVFRWRDGSRVTSAADLESLAEAIVWVPEESLLYHASRNHFSTWLMARTEFDLAHALRPRRAEEFASVAEVRKLLHDSLIEHREDTLAGVVAEFNSGAVRSANMFVRIGQGSLGGKGRGLAFMNALFNAYRIKKRVPGVRIFVPPTAILSTGVFEDFMEHEGLSSFVLEEEHPDEEITQAFLAADFPEQEREILRAFLNDVKYPLAVRSSSQLEDASFQPFAGVYNTFMLPNNNPDLEVRLEELVRAIKLVYASTYYLDARSYIESTPNRLEEEKMAVVIQQLVGRRFGTYHYPAIAGTARSRDFYPVEGTESADGVAMVALGLGNMIMDGGRGVRFSPKHPNRLHQFSSVDDYLKNSQREFHALSLDSPPSFSGCQAGVPDPYSNLASLGLDVAEEHGTLHAVGSIYSRENHAIYDGISRAGPRLVTMAGVLKSGVFPLAETLAFLLKVGEQGFGNPVEMEFAVTLKEGEDEPHEFGFLQIRPLGAGSVLTDIQVDGVELADAVCVSRRALGNGLIEGVTDLVYVRPERFKRSRTLHIAREIGTINRKIRADGRHYVLIGQGRWGSADKWLGIPVTWSQISAASCIVESDLPDIRVEPSQGTHFFQNITSLGIGYFTVNFGEDGGMIDYGWLDDQPAVAETEFVRHLRFADPLEIIMDGRQGLGVILKTGCKIVRKLGADHAEFTCSAHDKQ